MAGRSGMTSPFLPNLFRATAFPWSLSLALALINLFLIQRGSGIENERMKYEGMRHNGYLCKETPRCLCNPEHNDESSILNTMVCEEEVEIYIDTKNILVHCNSDNVTDPYQYVSFPRPLIPWDGRVYIEGCHPPNQGYSAIIKVMDGNKTMTMEHNSITHLYIDCRDLAEFHLSTSHFKAMNHLVRLDIKCSKLFNVSADLLFGISRKVKKIVIIGTLVDSIPDGFFANFSHLSYLNLNDNKLRNIQNSLFLDLEGLDILRLSRNRLELVEDDVFLSTKKMSSLDISDNLLSKIPSSLCLLRDLVHLNMTNNRIEFIPRDCLLQLVSIKALCLAGNRLLSLNSRVQPMKIMTSMQPKDYQTNKSCAVPPQNISDIFPYLSTTSERSTAVENKCFGSEIIIRLNVDNNLITSLPDNVFHGLSNLQILGISHNRITHLHQDTFVKNYLLRLLNASHNRLTVIPQNLLRNNIEVKLLDLSRNEISTLGSDFFSNISGLCELHLSDNKIDFLPTDIFKPFAAAGGAVSFCRNLTIKLDGNLLNKLPPLTIPWLKNLNLARNNLTNIDADMLKHVHELEVLDLSHNRIESLVGGPESHAGLESYSRIVFRGNLSKLWHVDLSGNRLLSIPFVDLDVSSLKYLNLSGNRISGLRRTLFLEAFDLPRIDAVKPELRVMDLSQNDIHIFEDLRLLAIYVYKHLDLSRNGMRMTCSHQYDRWRKVWGCESFFTWFRTLEVLILSHNDIDFIPMEFQYKMPRLIRVDLRYNRLSILWYHDFFFATGMSEMDLTYMFNFSENEKRLMPKIRDGDDSFYGFSNGHHITMDLRHNNIETVVLPENEVERVPQDCEVERKFAQATILLGNNPLNCDCTVFKLLQYSQKELRPIATIEKYTGRRDILPAVVNIQDLHCSKPGTVRGKAVSEPETWAHHLLPLVGLCVDQLGAPHPRKTLRWNKKP